MRSAVVLPNFNGVAPGQTASVSIPVGGVTYHKIALVYNCTNAGNGNQANTEAHLTEIRVLLNGKIQRRFSAKDLDSINAFYGRGFIANGTAGQLDIFFSEPWRRTVQSEDVLAWGTADVGTFQIQVDIAAAATGPSLSATAEVEYISRPNGVIAKWRKFNQVVSATGHNINNNLPKIAGEAYQAIHCVPTASTDITDVTVTVDNVIRFQLTEATANNLYTHYGNLTPQTALFSIVFDRTLRVSDALAMSYTQNGKATGQVVQDFRVDFNMNAANSFNFYTLVLGVRD